MIMLVGEGDFLEFPRNIEEERLVEERREECLVLESDNRIVCLLIMWSYSGRCCLITT